MQFPLRGFQVSVSTSILVRDSLVYYNKHRAPTARRNLPTIRTVREKLGTITLAQDNLYSYGGGLMKSFRILAARNTGYGPQ